MIANALLGLGLDPAAHSTCPGRYPENSTECVFMERAVNELALAKYGSDWTGDEPATRLPELLPDAFDPMRYNLLSGIDAANNSDEPAQWFDPPVRAVLERADDLLFQHRRDLVRPPRFMGLLSVSGLRPIRFTIRDWRIAQERDECMHALIRWFDLQKDIVSFCEGGLLVSRLRPVDGGEFSDPLPTSFWRCEKYAARFAFFMMHPAHPFKTDSNRQEWQWIFFTRASLRLALAKIRGANPSPASDSVQSYESEFLQHMRKVSLALAMNAQNPPKKVQVEEAIVRLWEGEKPLSKPDVAHMASFIRPLASRGGRNSSTAFDR